MHGHYGKVTTVVPNADEYSDINRYTIIHTHTHLTKYIAVTYRSPMGLIGGLIKFDGATTLPSSGELEGALPSTGPVVAAGSSSPVNVRT